MGIFSQEQHIEQRIYAPSFRPTETYIDCHNTIVSMLTHRRAIFDTALSQLTEHATSISNVAALLIDTLRSGHKVLVAGNGGSAAEAQHFAAELVGRFKREREPYAVLALNTDTAILTAIANDYGYTDIFARQVLALGSPGDLLIAFSTSGESENLLRAAIAARQSLMTVVAITGNLPCSLARHAHFSVHVPLSDTALVQELHMVVIHTLCDIAETRLSTIDTTSTTERALHPIEQDEWQQ